MKLARKDELARQATAVIAKAHLEAAKAWELGATEEEMKPAQQDIRSAQWRWDFAVASHGAFFHAPEEILRTLANAIKMGQDARLKLRVVLAMHNAADYEERWLHLLRQHSVDFKWSLCFWLRCRLYRWQHGDVGLFRCLPV